MAFIWTCKFNTGVVWLVWRILTCVAARLLKAGYSRDAKGMMYGYSIPTPT
jgi:hypothetical protein